MGQLDALMQIKLRYLINNNKNNNNNKNRNNNKNNYNNNNLNKLIFII